MHMFLRHCLNHHFLLQRSSPCANITLCYAPSPARTTPHTQPHICVCEAKRNGRAQGDGTQQATPLAHGRVAEHARARRLGTCNPLYPKAPRAPRKRPSCEKVARNARAQGHGTQQIVNYPIKISAVRFLFVCSNFKTIYK